MGYLIVCLMGYLLGCSSMAWYIGLLKKQDIRTAGSGNLGASNATVLFGWKAGVAVALHDIGKAALAVLLAQWFFPQLPLAGVAAGTAAVLGHMYPFYLGFQGGKGLASFLGMTLGLNWKLALLAVAMIFLTTVITDFISVGALSVIVLVPVCLAFWLGEPWMAAVASIASAAMLWKHRENIVRILRKEEIGLRSTIRGENRIQ